MWAPLTCHSQVNQLLPQLWYALIFSVKNGLADRGELTLADGAVLVGKFRSGQWLTGKVTMPSFFAYALLTLQGDCVIAICLTLFSFFSPGVNVLLLLLILTALQSTYSLPEADEFFEGVPDASLRMPAKGRFMAIPLPVARPAFPVNIAAGAMPRPAAAATASSSATLSPSSSGSSGPAVSPGSGRSSGGKLTPRK
jgi:hypothetical protein